MWRAALPIGVMHSEWRASCLRAAGSFQPGKASGQGCCQPAAAIRWQRANTPVRLMSEERSCTPLSGQMCRPPPGRCLSRTRRETPPLRRSWRSARETAEHHSGGGRGRKGRQAHNGSDLGASGEGTAACDGATISSRSGLASPKGFQTRAVHGVVGAFTCQSSRPGSASRVGSVSSGWATQHTCSSGSPSVLRAKCCMGHW